MEDQLKTLYRKFNQFYQKSFFLNYYQKYIASSLRSKVSSSQLSKIYKIIWQIDFFEFLFLLKNLFYFKDIKKKSWPEKSIEDALVLLNFLNQEKIISINQNGIIKILKPELFKTIPQSFSEKEIKKILEKKLNSQIENKALVKDLFKNFFKFQIKEKWDQLNISQESAIFLASQIFKKLPLKKRFLFVGDDDFISLIISLVDPEIESLVIDIDEEVLKNIEKIKRIFSLKIETKKINILKAKPLKEKFVGFLTNPPYNFEGLKKFVDYGNRHLREGGFCFLIAGDVGLESLRFLFPRFLLDKGLRPREIINGKIYYPFYVNHGQNCEYYREIFDSLKKILTEETIKEIIYQEASLLIFSKAKDGKSLPKIKREIYNYLF